MSDIYRGILSERDLLPGEGWQSIVVSMAKQGNLKSNLYQLRTVL